MAITYQWTINNTKSVLETKEFHSYVIVTVNWTLSAKEKTASASTSGKTVLSKPNTADFLPFNQVTNDNMVQWITGALGEATINTIKSALAAQIAKQLKTPINNLPQAVLMG